MNDLTKELNFETLNNNFNNVCDEVNNGNEAMTLTLKSGRKVFLMNEESYDNISRFVIVKTSANAFKQK